MDKLTNRIQPGKECRVWVYRELKELETELYDLKGSVRDAIDILNNDQYATKAYNALTILLEAMDG